MTDHEIPREGGKYLRQADGSLKRIEQGAPVEADQAKSADHAKGATARTKKARE